MRPLSVVSDLDAEIYQLCEQAQVCGLEPDQIQTIILKAVEKWKHEIDATIKQHHNILSRC